MEIIVGKTAGFCFGVSNAVYKSKEELEKHKNLYCLGELVHNKEVTKELEEEGLQFVDNVEEAKENVIIRAHGEPEVTYIKAKDLGLNVIDLTCPKVIKIHDIAKDYATSGYYIFLVGQKEHPETIGTISYCGEFADIIEKEEDIEVVLEKFKNSNISNLLIISQTTFSMEKFELICKKIKERLDGKYNIEIKNTICNATKLRQEETEELSEEVELMIIIGGRHSSNTNKLYNIATSKCKNSILIENKDELDINYIKQFDKIGIMAGASTPEKSVNEVVDLLKKL